MATRDDFPVSALADVYDLGPWESIELLPGGKCDHYRLITGSGEYAIRRSHRYKTSADMRFEHELVAHLRDSGFSAWGTPQAASWGQLDLDDASLKQEE